MNAAFGRIDFGFAYETLCVLAVLAAIPLALAGRPGYAMAGIFLAAMRFGH